METRARGIPDSSAVASAHLIVAHDVRGSQTVQTVRHPVPNTSARVRALGPPATERTGMYWA